MPPLRYQTRQREHVIWQRPQSEASIGEDLIRRDASEVGGAVCRASQRGRDTRAMRAGPCRRQDEHSCRSKHSQEDPGSPQPRAACLAFLLRCWFRLLFVLLPSLFLSALFLAALLAFFMHIRVMMTLSISSSPLMAVAAPSLPELTVLDPVPSGRFLF